MFPRLHIDDLAQDGTIFEGVVTQLSRGSARSDAVLIQAGGNGVIRLRGDDAMRADIDRAVALTEALRIPEAIAQQAPLAVVATRLNAWRSVEPGPLAAMAEFDTNQQRLANSEDATEGVASFQGRRTARSLGR